MSDTDLSTSQFWFLFLETLSDQGNPSGFMTVKGLSPNFDVCLEKALLLQKSFPTRWVGLYQERKKGFFPPQPVVEEMDVLIWCSDEDGVFVAAMPGLQDNWPF